MLLVFIVLLPVMLLDMPPRCSANQRHHLRARLQHHKWPKIARHHDEGREVVLSKIKHVTQSLGTCDRFILLTFASLFLGGGTSALYFLVAKDD